MSSTARKVKTGYDVLDRFPVCECVMYIQGNLIGQQFPAAWASEHDDRRGGLCAIHMVEDGEMGGCRDMDRLRDRCRGLCRKPRK